MDLQQDASDWRDVLSGDGEAFGRIWDRHNARVERHVTGLVSRPADVDDAVAIVFLQAWRQRAAVRVVNDSVLPWLLVTATHVAHNVRRGSHRYAALLARLPSADHAPDPAELVADGDASLAMRRLSLLDQEILTLCVLEELTEREASEALHIRPGTVKSRLHRARAHLADQFKALSDLSLTSPEAAHHES